LKPLVFAAALVPFALLIWRGFTGNLSADPLAEITNETGIVSFIAVTLAITPLRAHRLESDHPVPPMLGLFAFFYARSRLYVLPIALPASISPTAVAWAVVICWRDLGRCGQAPLHHGRFIAFVSMIPLALTRPRLIRRLGGRNWQRLPAVYLTGIAGVTHYWWKVKADTLHPAIYAAIVTVLLGYRLVLSFRRSRWQRQPVQARA
jgi:sulfoxide reductase heme-binding subunit YedZ